MQDERDVLRAVLQDNPRHTAPAGPEGLHREPPVSQTDLIVQYFALSMVEIMSQQQLQMLTNVVVTEKFKKGEIIKRANDQFEGVNIVKHGEVIVQYNLN